MRIRFLALLAVLSLVAAGCGSDVPEGAVARIDDNTIEKSNFDHWLKVAAGQTAAQAGGQGAAPSPADNFAGCVRARRKATPKPPKGQTAPSDEELRTQCKREYDGLRDQVLEFLIAANWVQGEAADQGVRVTDQELKRAIDQVRKQSFPKQADFERYLRQSGLTMEDVRFQTRVEQLQNKLVDKITKGQDRVTDAQVRRYYEQNKARFGQPARRDIQVVLTRMPERAQAAKRALDAGQGFGAVVRRFSQDATTKAQGGRIPGVVRGQQLEGALDRAVFAAKPNEVTGPVKTQFGYYLFRVTKVTPAEQQSLKEATPAIRQLLQQQAQQRAVETFVREYRDKWSDQTNCAEQFIVASCGNAPKELKERAERELRQQQQQQQQTQVPAS